MKLTWTTVSVFPIMGVLITFTGCAPGTYVPPVSISAGFFGAQVTVAEPGYTVPAKVVTTQSVQQPTLIVPASAPIMTGSAPVITSAGEVSKVPVVVSQSVQSPVLAVPSK